MLFKAFFIAISFAAVFFAAPGWGSAQNAPAPPASIMPSQGEQMQSGGMRHRNRMREDLESLDLSDAQRQQIKGFMKQFRDSKESGTPETRRQLRAQIESVLTPDQKTKLQSEMHPNGRN